MKIGIASTLYATPKGHSYVIRDFVKLLMSEGHTVDMYRIGNNDIGEEFPLPTSIKTNNELVIKKEDFESWLDEKTPDYCIFMEYQQWWDEDHDKVAICKERGIKTVGFLVHEKLDWNKLEHYKQYTKLIAPTQYQTKLQRSKGLYNTVYVPWGVDMSEIDSLPTPVRDEADKNCLIFYHCAGSGGVGDRKNTESIIKAYNKIKDEHTRLMITHLGKKIFSRKEILSFTKYSDVVINTSRWDTIGLNTLESNACEKPIIVCDASPMNELVMNNVNGFLIPCTQSKTDVVTCVSNDVDIDELSKKMAFFKNTLILNVMKNSARVYAERNFDWKTNKIQLLKVFS